MPTLPGEIEGGRDLGVAEAAVPQDQGHGLLAGQAGQCFADAPALVAGDDRVGDIRGDGVAVIGGLFARRAAATGTEVVERGMRHGDGQPAHRLSRRDRGAPEREEGFLSHVLGFVPGAEDAGGDRDDPRVGGAEDVFEVRADARPLLRFSSDGRRGWLGWNRHGYGVLPLRDLHTFLHTYRAPPEPEI